MGRKKKVVIDLDPEKTKLINRLDAYYKDNKIYKNIDFKKFKREELEFHYLKLQGKVKDKYEYSKLKNKGIIW